MFLFIWHIIVGFFFLALFLIICGAGILLLEGLVALGVVLAIKKMASWNDQ